MKNYRVPVYSKTLTLLEKLDKNTEKSPVWFRNEVANKYKGDVVKILAYIIEGSLEEDKLRKNILASLSILGDLKIRMRASTDARYITQPGFGEIARPLEEARRQLKNWGRSIGVKEEEFPKSFNLYDPSDKVEFID